MSNAKDEGPSERSSPLRNSTQRHRNNEAQLDETEKTPQAAGGTPALVADRFTDTRENTRTSRQHEQKDHARDHSEDSERDLIAESVR